MDGLADLSGDLLADAMDGLAGLSGDHLADDDYTRSLVLLNQSFFHGSQEFTPFKVTHLFENLSPIDKTVRLREVLIQFGQSTDMHFINATIVQ